jgi:hypothetical protein
MTQEIALLRFRAARHHREGDAPAMARTATGIVSMAQRCLDERQSDFVLRAMAELLADAAVAVDRMRREDPEASTTLARAAEDLKASHGGMVRAVRMISRNPADSLDERPLSRHVLRTLLGLDGVPATIEEIAARAERDVDAVRDIMTAIHGHGHSTLEVRDGMRRYALSTKGRTPSLLAADQNA